jgi:hypothetical protein
MENKDIVGREFTCFEFSSERLLTYGDQANYVGLTGKVIQINSAYPQYARVAVTDEKGVRKEPHYPTHLIKEQLEAKDREEEENKTVDDLLIEMKQLISQI